MWVQVQVHKFSSCAHIEISVGRGNTWGHDSYSLAQWCHWCQWCIDERVIILVLAKGGRKCIIATVDPVPVFTPLMLRMRISQSLIYKEPRRHFASARAMPWLAGLVVRSSVRLRFVCTTSRAVDCSRPAVLIQHDFQLKFNNEHVWTCLRTSETSERNVMITDTGWNRTMATDLV